MLPRWFTLADHSDSRGFSCCRGCVHLHAHHIVHWADGGPTIVENLIMVCSHHHRLLHDDGWGVALHRDGTTAWSRPVGAPFVPGPLTRLRELKRHLARHRDPPTAPARPTGTPTWRRRAQPLSAGRTCRRPALDRRSTRRSAAATG
jgi:hypothetical protein